MGKKKIVIDTNNLISALGWKGYSRKLFELVIDKKVEWFISLYRGEYAIILKQNIVMHGKNLKKMLNK